MHLFVISGPSGVGKTTLVRKLVEVNRSLRLCVSCTTRPKREGEVDGGHYRFLDTENFLSLRDKNEFLEWAEVHGNMYGTLWSEIRGREYAMDRRNPVLEIDCQGAATIAKKFKVFTSIFILPPTFQTLETRIVERRRGESPAEIEARLKNARDEILRSREFHHRVVNDDFEKAVRILLRITLTRVMQP